MRRNVFESYMLEQGSGRGLASTTPQVGMEADEPVRSLSKRITLQRNHSLMTTATAEEDEALRAIRMQMKEQALAKEVFKRRQKRRRKAHGSTLRYYCATRLQLRDFLQPTNLFIFLLGALVLVAIWIFLVYGKPDDYVNSHWPGITSNASESDWGGLLGSEDLLCEEAREFAFTKQPSNALATLSYALVGWFLLFMWALDWRRNNTFEARFGNLPASLLLRRSAWSALLGSSLAFLAVGAYLRHATMSQTGKRLETSGYWTILFALTTCSLTRLIDLPRKLRSENGNILSTTLTLVAIFATVGVDIWFGIRLEILRAPMIPEIVFGNLAGLSLLSTLVAVCVNYRHMESEVWWIFFGLVLFVAGFLLARFDSQSLCGSRTAFYQSYALWHVLCALTLLCFYLYLRTDLWRKGDGAEFAPRIRPFYSLYRALRALTRNFKELVRDEDRAEVQRQDSKRITANRQRVGELEEEKDEERAAVEEAAPAVASSKKVDANSFNMVQLKFAQAVCGFGITGAVVYIIYLALSDPK